ncbi:MAG: hypothetical protein NC930_02925 [Candidatus Omnitrophica bacterium]|nr:hypothetical protein [Candidatus Omnitrophota bacterium]
MSRLVFLILGVALVFGCAETAKTGKDSTGEKLQSLAGDAAKREAVALRQTMEDQDREDVMARSTIQ